MPLNKLDNFIKNTEGRILYVSPSDLDSTDSISNEGNSLARPFKTIQRALIESARFSYIRGRSNDVVEKTTILLMPGEHIIDNRPGYRIYNNAGTATVSPSGTGAASNAQVTLNLDLNSNFDLTQDSNILYKFNSVDGGAIVPRGVSIVGLDLRKTKIRPKYIPNPTDPNVPTSSLFKVTGSCYFWQFSVFDGNDLGLVYTDNNNFGIGKQASPTFSHHKLTVFEYADGVNKVILGNDSYDLTDLDMYYAKLGNAYNIGSGREIKQAQKYPQNPRAFEKQRPEYEIVGAFASDPLKLTFIQAGDDNGATSVVTVRTELEHNLQVGTPIKIRGVTPTAYNISAVVTWVSDTNDKEFTYTIANVDPLLPRGSTTVATVTVETDTVEGASPYIFNCSMRSVYGMNGLKADGNKATGFKSMVVAQFTGVSLQKDDRAFTKYNPNSRQYESINIDNIVDGAELSGGSSQTATGKAYHLDSGAIYRQGWETTHIKMENDAILQIVSVFAIGYAKHFTADTGSDASITNSNSNFGQLSLVSHGFKNQAFNKDNKGFITSVITPRNIESNIKNLDWISLDSDILVSGRLYLEGYDTEDNLPPVTTQGYKIGAKVNDKIYLNISGVIKEASILMGNGNSSYKSYSVITSPSASSNSFTFATNSLGPNDLLTGEKVILQSDNGDLPENIQSGVVYFIINNGDNTSIKLATSEANATNGGFVNVSGGSNIKIISRVSDKIAGDINHPVQWDASNSNWYIITDSTTDTIQPELASISNRTDDTFLKRTEDVRSLDEKLYKLRVVVPRESSNAKDPENGFVIQSSSSTGALLDSDFTKTDLLTESDYEFERNPSYISTCTSAGSPTDTAIVITELPHNLDVGDTVIIKNVTDTINTTGIANTGYNGTHTVTGITNNLTFTYVPGKNHGNFNNDTSNRTTSLPRFERNNLQSNLYVYRSEVISNYIENEQDGVYHVYVLSADNNVGASAPEFTEYDYSQNVVDLYPQLDKDNVNSNPPASKSFAQRSPLGEVVTNNLKNSLTRESLDKFTTKFGIGVTISSVVDSISSAALTFSERHSFAGIATANVEYGGTGYNTGTYYNVKLYNEEANTNWYGATAKVVVDGTGAVDSADIQYGGAGYGAGLVYFDKSIIGTPSAAGYVRVHSTGLTANAGSNIQITGIGTADSSYYRVSSITNDTQINIAKSSGDPEIVVGQYVLNIGPVITASKTDSAGTVDTFDSTASSNPHGLVAGNTFQVNDTSDNNLGSFYVKTVIDAYKFTSDTTIVAGSYDTKILKHGYGSNSKVSDITSENLGARSTVFYTNEFAKLKNSLTNTSGSNVIAVETYDGLSGIIERFPYGSYIQIGGEIMRIASPILGGTSNNELTVIRGSLGSNVETHSANTQIRGIKPLAIEFRRPSILRASGHTFEYLGYGPGNYSTALPQVQVKTISEREEFLVQSQERSGGIVVYTGMNNKGDFFIGNQKKSSATGEETTFDTPIPTVTGQKPSRLSSVFDEVTIKERIIVEGGKTNQILSQFDGPVTINQSLKINSTADISGKVRISDDTPASSTTTGALQVVGGVGIGSNLYVGAETDSTSTTTGSVVITGGVGIGKSVAIGSSLSVNNDLLVSGTTESTGITTGALVVAGGVGIGSTVNIGGSLFVDGSIRYVDKLTINEDGVDVVGGSIQISSADGSKSVALTANGSVEIYRSDNLPHVDFKNGAGDDWDQRIIANTSGNLVFKTKDPDDNTNQGYLRIGHDGVEIGSNTTNGNLYAQGDITAYYTSDKRLKDNISPIKQALDKVNSLSGNTFDWNAASNKEGTEVGVIAQEVDALDLPGITTLRDNGTYAVRYEKLVPLLIEAIKELSGKVDSLEQKLSDK